MRRTLISVLSLGGAAVAALVSFILWPELEPSIVSRALLVNAVIVACCGAVIAVLFMGDGKGWVRWAPWIVAGALVGAAAIGIVAVCVWLLLAASLFAASGAIGGLGGKRGLLARLAVAGAAALLNIAILWVPQMGAYGPISPAKFQAEDFRIHSFLSDVPLHDVWMVTLRGGGSGRDIRDVQELFVQGPIEQRTPIVIGLAALRGLLGFTFRWDAAREGDQASSYLHRLTAADRERSILEPDRGEGVFFRRIYTFEREVILEIINRTVHAFFAMGMVPADDGYTLYWAIYVKRVNWFTPYYMALVDPFRRLFVYPAWMRRLEHGWAVRWRTPTESPEPAR